MRSHKKTCPDLTGNAGTQIWIKVPPKDPDPPHAPAAGKKKAKKKKKKKQKKGEDGGAEGGGSGGGFDKDLFDLSAEPTPPKSFENAITVDLDDDDEEVFQDSANELKQVSIALVIPMLNKKTHKTHCR